ncbi:conserved protein of unknown function [Georgfuchsia toluolica]|uniref:DNA-binding protein n=1 Tax=Georgfuchsia toluolica TaxID=424218 RepID=A0A916J160_9PROT|nr:DUF6496 domain-containing protein [Georgfuchsia toluolica]CAG4882797.1 conserved protein of unknown function [Georgfuchsia toluolica]
MPEKRTLERAAKDKRAGKLPSTQAGEFVREEIEHVRQGKHGARSTKQAIAIGLSKARRTGVKLPPPKVGTASEKTRTSTNRDYAATKSSDKPVSRSRSQATTTALKREPHAAASKETVGRQAKSVAQRRNANERSTAAQKSARAKGAAGRSAAAHKAARARAGTQSYGQKPVLLLHDSYHLERAEIVFCGVGCSKPYHF